MSRPCAFAVCRLITSSNRAGLHRRKISRLFALKNPADVMPRLATIADLKNLLRNSSGYPLLHTVVAGAWPEFDDAQ